MIETLRVKRETLDQLEIETLLEMQESRSWNLVMARVDRMLTHYMADLLHAKTWEDALRLQGKIDAAQSLRTLPQTLIEEAKQQHHQQKGKRHLHG